MNQFYENWNVAQEGTGDTEAAPGFEMEIEILNWGPIGGVVLMVGPCVWFFWALSAGVEFAYPPILFLIGLAGFIAGIQRTIARKKSQIKLKEMDKLIAKSPYLII